MKLRCICGRIAIWESVSGQRCCDACVPRRGADPFPRCAWGGSIFGIDDNASDVHQFCPRCKFNLNATARGAVDVFFLKVTV